MKKEIKDYLHFYLGCEAIIENKLKVIICGFQQDGHNVYKPVIRPLHYLGFDNKIINDLFLIKPILRPLSDMTEEEKTEFQNIAEIEKEDLSCVTYKPSFFNNDLLELGTAHLTNILQWANGVKYLLSKNFDLFNLISENLAIDATTLKK